MGRPPPPCPSPCPLPHTTTAPPPIPQHVRSGVHEDGAHFVHAGFLQVGAGSAQLMAAALEVLLLEDGNLEESGGLRAGHAARGGTRCPQPPPQHGPMSAAAWTSRRPPKTGTSVAFNQPASVKRRLHPSERAALAPGCLRVPSGTGPAPRCCSQGDARARTGLQTPEQLWLGHRGRERGARHTRGRHRGSRGGRAPPAQHTFHGSAGRRGDRSAVSAEVEGRLGADPFPHAPPAPGHASKIPCVPHPAPIPSSLCKQLSTAAGDARHRPGALRGDGEGCTVVAQMSPARLGPRDIPGWVLRETEGAPAPPQSGGDATH